ncbi:MAG: TerB family tellurite resistance protein [Alphaproteobacteria bacterium]|nr:TerB family tellurite resistance protein [Alphaproteobacteria bacterium]
MAFIFKKIQGKLIGGLLGFFFAGLWGLLFGVIVGHLYDKQARMSNDVLFSLWRNHEAFAARLEQAAFTMGVVVLSAKMARADGRISQKEINAFKRVFRITPEQENSIGLLFDRARLSPYGFEPYALNLAQVFHHTPSVLEEILSGLFIIGTADSETLSPSEIVFLKKVSALFGFSTEDFVRIAARSGVTLPESERPRHQPPEAFEVLGVDETASPQEIKRAYRALIREHHPDKLIAQGMPQEFVATATEKMKRINAAYDTVCKIKGMT